MSWDKDKPAGTDALQDSDDYIRANNAAIETALNQDHEFVTGGNQTGKHEVITFLEQATPGASSSNEAYLTVVDSGTQPELEFTSEDGTAVTLTASGKIPSASLDMKDEDDMASDSATHAATQQSIKAFVTSGTVTMTNKTLTSPTINSATLDSPTINTAISGTAILDEDNMASNSDTQVPTQQSVKAYVNAQRAWNYSGAQIGGGTITVTTGGTMQTLSTGIGERALCLMMVVFKTSGTGTITFAASAYSGGDWEYNETHYSGANRVQVDQNARALVLTDCNASGNVYLTGDVTNDQWDIYLIGYIK